MKFKPQERQQMLGLLAALQSGLDPMTGLQLYQGVLGQAQQRIDERRQRLADMREQQQGLLPGLQDMILQAAIQGIPSDVVAHLVSSRLSNTPGMIGNPLYDRYSRDVKDLISRLYDGQDVSPLAPAEAQQGGLGTGQLDEEDYATVRSLVEQAAAKGHSKEDIETSIKSQLVQAGVSDPLVMGDIQRIIDNTWNRVQQQLAAVKAMQNPQPQPHVGSLLTRTGKIVLPSSSTPGPYNYTSPEDVPDWLRQALGL
jgi:hypothetical protein